MHPSVQKYLEAASGLGTLTATKAEQLVKQLIRSGEAAGDQMSELVDGLMERQRQNRDAVTALVRKEAAKAVSAMGVATAEDVEELKQTVIELEQEVAGLRAQLATSAPRSSAAAVGARRGSGSAAAKVTKKAGAKKTAAKKTATKTAATTPAERAAKMSAKKTSAKKTAKKTASKATATTPAKRAAKTTTAKTTTAKTTTAKTTPKKTGGTSAPIAARNTELGTGE